MKKILSLIICAILSVCSMISLVGCGKKSDDLVVWTFTDELKTMVNDYYKKAYPNAKVDVKIFEVNDLATKLNMTLKAKKGLPDVVAIEQKYIREYALSGYFMDLSDMSGTEQMYTCTLDAAKNKDGKVVGYAWQATPGVMYYRADMAKEILDVDNPEEMQAMVSTWEGVLNVAAQLKAVDDSIVTKYTGLSGKNLEEHGKGIRIFSDNTAPAKVFYSNREKSWIDSDGTTLAIDSSLYEGDYSLMEIVKKLEMGTSTEWGNVESYDPYINRNQERATGWFNDMSNGQVFSFLMPSYSLSYDFEKYCGDSEGKWAICEGPQNYTDGGTWLGIINHKDTKVDEAKQLISYFTTNTEFLTAWANKTGDFINNTTLMQQFAADPAKTHKVLANGQNPYVVFNKVAASLRSDNLTKHDAKLCEEFKTWCLYYAQLINLDTTDTASAKKSAVQGFINYVATNTNLTVCENPVA